MSKIEVERQRGEGGEGALSVVSTGCVSHPGYAIGIAIIFSDPSVCRTALGIFFPPF